MSLHIMHTMKISMKFTFSKRKKNHVQSIDALWNKKNYIARKTKQTNQIHIGFPLRFIRNEFR